MANGDLLGLPAVGYSEWVTEYDGPDPPPGFPDLSEPIDAVYAGPRVTHYHPLGAGLIRPFFRTEHGDFASYQGPDVIMSNLGQVFGTDTGTLPWRTEFGSRLGQLRFKANTPTVRELAGVFVRDALSRWESRARLKDITVDQVTRDTENQITVRPKVWIDGEAEERRLAVSLYRLEERQVPTAIQAWRAEDRTRVPRGMGSLIELEPPPVVMSVDAVSTGLARPFRRVSRDFDRVSGPREIFSNIGQVLGTRKKTLPWRPEFGSRLEDLRQRNNSYELRELARLFVEQAVTLWEPRANVSRVQVLDVKRGEENTVVIRVLCGISVLELVALQPIDVAIG